MKSTMSEGPDCFAAGSVVSCNTCYEQDIRGEVLAFDQEMNAVILTLNEECTGNKANLCDVRILNLEYVTETTILEKGSTPSVLPPLNTEKLNNRIRQNVEERQWLANAVSSGVSSDGLNLFLAIRKTINDVTWSGLNIVVMKTVCIVPPYRAENCSTQRESDQDALTHVRNIVEKHIRDQQRQTTTQDALQ